jgi:hypothetical protein
MNLKSHNMTNTTFTGQRIMPMIHFNIMTGLFRINKAAVQLLKLEKGKLVELFQDIDNPTDWYVALSGDKGFELRFKSKVTNGLFFSNKKLADILSRSVRQMEGIAGRVIIKKVGMKYKGRLIYKVDTESLIPGE